MGRGPDRGLGRPVHVDDLRLRETADLGGERGGHRLAAEQNLFEPAEGGARARVGEDHPRHARRALQHRRLVPGELGGEREIALPRTGARERDPRRLAHDHDRVAAGEGVEELKHRDVEAEAGDREPGAVWGQERVHAGEEIGEVAVLDLHALGGAGGAGGVDHVGQRIGGEVDRGAVGIARARDHHRHRVGGRQAGGQGQVGDDEGGLAVGDVMGEAVGGIGRVERHIGGADLVDGEGRDHQLEAAGEVDADPVAGLRAFGDQPVGERVGAAVEFGIAHAAVVDDERGGVGGAVDLGLEGAVDGGEVGLGPGGVPSDQRQGAFTGREREEVAHGTLRFGREAVEEQREPVGEQCEGRVVDHPRVAPERDPARVEREGERGALDGIVPAEAERGRLDGGEVGVTGDEVGGETAGARGREVGGERAGEGCNRLRGGIFQPEAERHPGAHVARMRPGGGRDSCAGIGEAGAPVAGVAQTPGREGGKHGVVVEPRRRVEAAMVPGGAAAGGRGEGEPGGAEASEPGAPMRLHGGQRIQHAAQRFGFRRVGRGEHRVFQRLGIERYRAAGEVGKPAEPQGAVAGGHRHRLRAHREHRAGLGGGEGFNRAGAGDREETAAGLDLGRGQRVPAGAEIERPDKAGDLRGRLGEIEPPGHVQARDGRRAPVGAVLRTAGEFAGFKLVHERVETLAPGRGAFGGEGGGGIGGGDGDGFLDQDVARLPRRLDEVPGDRMGGGAGEKRPGGAALPVAEADRSLPRAGAQRLGERFGGGDGHEPVEGDVGVEILGPRHHGVTCAPRPALHRRAPAHHADHRVAASGERVAASGEERLVADQQAGERGHGGSPSRPDQPARPGGAERPVTSARRWWLNRSRAKR